MRRCVAEGASAEEEGFGALGVYANGLSEEEMLAYELGDLDGDLTVMDLELDEKEAAEWAKYDEEVMQFERLMESTGDARRTEGDCMPEGLDGFDLERAALAFEESLSREDSSGASGSLLGGALLSAPVPLVLGGGVLNLKPSPQVAEVEGSVARLLSEYKSRFAQGQGGVAVSESLGSQNVVIVSVPDQPDTVITSGLSDTFRRESVRVLRGWYDTSGEQSMNVLEVCDSKSGQSLSAERASKLEKALLQAVRTPAARRVVYELEDQLPALASVLSSQPAAGSTSPPGLAAARSSLSGGPFFVSEAHDLGQCLVFRGQLDEAVEAREAREMCQRQIMNSAPECSEEWECYLLRSPSGPLLLVLPTKAVEEATAPAFDQRILFSLLCGIAVLCAQAVVPSAPGVTPPVGLMILGTTIVGEMARRTVANRYGVRVGLPMFLPSPSIGSFGAASRTESVLPDACAFFDMVMAAATAALLTSFLAIAVGMTSAPSEHSCTWINPGVLPYALQQLAYTQAEPLWDVCLDPPPTSAGAYLPASTAFVAGAFGAMTAMLNILPLGRLDGMAIAAASRWSMAKDVLLPWAAFILLGIASLDANAESLFPIVLRFGLSTFLVRPWLINEPVFRDNLTMPRDFQRRGTGFVMYCFAFMILCPSVLIDLFTRST